MVIREKGRFFILIRQHDHGLLSGEIAAHWGNEHFQRAEHKLVLTASLHDASWIKADAALPWNEKEDRPFDFTSLPFETRLPMYEKGLELTEQLHPYAGLLTSMHYCSFFKEGQDKRVDRFLQMEKKRQKKLKRIFFNETVDFDLHHLQCWDNLSLYVCLNRPGTAKEDEHPWFKKGIGAVTKTGKKVMIQAHWLNERTITLDPFPFRDSWSTTLPYSKVRQSLGSLDPDKGKTYDQHLCFIPA